MNGRLTRTITGLTGLIATLVLGTGGGSFGTTPAGATGTDSTYQAAATFTGPITTGSVIEPLSANPLQLAANGYVQQEFFAAGKATAFTAKSEPSNGRWSILPGTTASYQTRILVRRPKNPAHFNGNVVVEWMNVSAGESAPDWDYLNPELMRAGFAYVAVSVQHLGVNGGAPILGTPGGSANATASGGLVGSEPARYGSLHQPGDQYALDIYAQIGRALHNPKNGVLGTLHPKHVLALGESQSAFYLTTYADALAATDAHVRRDLHPQSGRQRCPAERNHHHRQAAGPEQPAHPHRPQRAGVHVRNPDRPHRARLRPGTTAQHLSHPHVAGGRHIPCRCL